MALPEGRYVSPGADRSREHGTAALRAGEDVNGVHKDDHPLRRRIMDMVTRRPGMHYSLIRDELGRKDGVVSHHLHVLETRGRLSSRVERRRRCYYPTSRGHPETGVHHLSDLQAGILYHIQMRQGMTHGELARKLGVSKQVLTHHMRDLCARKLVYRRREGRHTRFYVHPGRLSDELLEDPKQGGPRP